VKALRTFGPVLLMFAVVFSLIGWGAASYRRPHFSPPTATGGIPAPASLRPDLARVLADQRQADRDHREAWLADGYSHDLQVLADDGINPLAADAQAYLDAAYAGPDGNAVSAPPPGWQGPYAQLRADLNAMAAQYGLAPAPAPGYPVSGAAVPLHPWSAPAGGTGSGACTAAGGTVSSSTSSTGAHSQSVSVKTKCPAGTTTVTRKTSVSSTGAVTNTTTTTTAPPSTSSSSSGSSSG
jgi:hypothetical protein